ncbi:unnamed protein product [Penicillium pancosmium]
MTARNPSLATLSGFLDRQHLTTYRSSVSYIEIGQGVDTKPQETGCSELVSKVNLGLTKGVVAVVENIQPIDVETFGSAWDIDPFFFCGHVGSSYNAVEDGMPPPLMALPPSRIASQEYFNIHYHNVLDLGDESTIGNMPYKLALAANIPRIVRRLPAISGRAIGLARNCCSVLKKNFSNGSLILVDPSTADITAGTGRTGSNTQFEDIGIRILQVPRRINIEDFRELPTYSQFPACGSADSDSRCSNLREQLIGLFQETPPNWKTEDPCILSLIYYPFKLVVAEWMLYSWLMGRYVKFYEYSFQTAQSRGDHFEHADIPELHRWRRRSQQSLHKLRMMRYFVEYWGEMSPKSIWHQLVLDFQHLEEQINQHARSLETLNPMNTSLVQLIDSRKSISQAEDVKRLSFIALVFIPLSYVTGIFSMAEQYGPGSDRFWIYWATSLPIAIVVVCISFMTDSIPKAFRFRRM